MPNIATILKHEISRVARREVRGETQSLKKAAGAHRAEIAALKRRTHDCGLLLGVSGQSIYNWEEGKARPRAKHLPAVAALRTLGKKAATAHLESLKGSG